MLEHPLEQALVEQALSDFQAHGRRT